ncbi:hypothetical protein H4R35_007539 [Dimargaris xerosporica]|nr:hypothetical protein H4R35_007539 [Dimargaris xerosporica]
MPNAAGAPMQPPMDPNGYPMNSAPHFAPPVPAYYGDKPYHGLDDQTVALHHGYNQLSNRFDDPTQLALARPYQRADGSPFAAAMGGDPSLASYYTRFPTAKRTRSTTTKNKRYICQICHSAFARPSTLSTHMNKHTGAKPHMCPHPGCGKRFSVLSNMRRHRRIHDRNQAQSQMAAAAAAAAAAAVAGPSPLPSTLPATIIQQPKLEQVL